MKRIALAVVFLATINLIVAQTGEKKFALLIANSSYDLYPLKHAKADLTFLGKELEKLGFKVFIFSDLDYRGMKTCLKQYGDSLLVNKGAVSFFYFIGHGLQLEGNNYLIPINAQIENELDIKLETVDMKLVLNQTCPQSNFLNVVVIDVPPKNPVHRFLVKPAYSGLAHLNPPFNSIIAFSSTPLSVPSDHKFNEWVYIEAFVKAIQVQDIGIYDVFKRTRKRVYTITKGLQIPWETSSFDGQFYFNKN